MKTLACLFAAVLLFAGQGVAQDRQPGPLPVEVGKIYDFILPGRESILMGKVLRIVNEHWVEITEYDSSTGKFAPSRTKEMVNLQTVEIIQEVNENGAPKN